MRFAVSRASKAISIGALGAAAAILVACGDSNGLLPGDQASRLSSALDGVAAACEGGDVSRAQSAAARFSQDVSQLRAATVDRELIQGLRQGASTLEQLVSDTCTTETVPTTTETVPPPVTVETTPETTPQTTPETTPEPPPTTTPTTPPDTGGGTDGGDGGDTGDGGTTPPDGGDGGTTDPNSGDSGGGAADPAQPSDPGVNQGDPGGAAAPGTGGTP